MHLIDPFVHSAFNHALGRAALSEALRTECLAAEVVDDDVVLDRLVVYTDGSAEPGPEWPRVFPRAGWALVVCAQRPGCDTEVLVGVAFDPVRLQGETGHMGGGPRHGPHS